MKLVVAPEPYAGWVTDLRATTGPLARCTPFLPQEDYLVGVSFEGLEGLTDAEYLGAHAQRSNGAHGR